jgi:hypothetical protein
MSDAPWVKAMRDKYGAYFDEMRACPKCGGGVISDGTDCTRCGYRDGASLTACVECGHDPAALPPGVTVAEVANTKPWLDWAKAGCRDFSESPECEVLCVLFDEYARRSTPPTRPQPPPSLTVEEACEVVRESYDEGENAIIAALRRKAGGA